MVCTFWCLVIYSTFVLWMCVCIFFLYAGLHMEAAVFCVYKVKIATTEPNDTNEKKKISPLKESSLNEKQDDNKAKKNTKINHCDVMFLCVASYSLLILIFRENVSALCKVLFRSIVFPILIAFYMSSIFCCLPLCCKTIISI